MTAPGPTRSSSTGADPLSPTCRYTRTMEICQRLAGADPDNTQHHGDVIGSADALARVSNRRAILVWPTIGRKPILISDLTGLHSSVQSSSVTSFYFRRSFSDRNHSA